MSTTNLKNELIENGDSNYDFSRQDDVEYIISEMVIGPSDCAEEVAERTAALVEMLKPEDAPAVFKETVMYIGTRTGDFMDDHYDAYLNTITPWLVKQGFPDLRPKQ